MAIRVAHRAQVEDDFAELYQRFLHSQIDRAKQLLDRLGDRAKSQPAWEAAKRAHRVLHSEGTLRANWDHELTRLRALPYEKFFVHRQQGISFFAGITRDLVIKGGGTSYDAGEYLVLIRASMMAQFHLLPVDDITRHARHPHHTGSGDLTVPANTCFGSFTALPAILDFGDLPESFRALHIFLSRYNPHSPLTHAAVLRPI